MCERYTLYAANLDRTHWALRGRPFLDEPVGFERPIRARYNIAPGAAVPIVIRRPNQRPMLVKARWGLVPRTSPTPSTDLSTHTARSDKVAMSRLYGGPLRRARCLVPASGWYGFKNLAKHGGRDGQQAYYVQPRNAGEICFAGLWERWSGPGAAAFDSFSIITVPQNGLLDYVCPRMPAVLEPGRYLGWLDPAERNLEAILAMLQAPSAADFEVRQVTDRVNDVRHDDEGLIRPVTWGEHSEEERWALAMDYTEDELRQALAKVQMSPLWRSMIEDITPRDLLRIARALERNVPKRPA